MVFKIANNNQLEHGKDTRTFDEVYATREEAIIRHIKELLVTKKSMDMRLRVSFDVEHKVIARTKNGKEKSKNVKHKVTLSSKTPERVTKNNVEEVVERQINIIREKYDLVGGGGGESGGGGGGGGGGGDGGVGFITGWSMAGWHDVSVDQFATKPLRAGSYLPTPERYANPRSGLINIRNDDQLCFKWCMMYHQSPKGKHDDRITALRTYEDKYNYDGISYPTSYDEIDHFQEVNQVCIYVYTIDENNNIICDHVGKTQYIK
jgi:hypothetical protein